MKFLEIVKKLQLKNNGYIVLVKNGIFFIGEGRIDTNMMVEILKLEKTFS